MAETFITTATPLEIRLAPTQYFHVSDVPLLDIFGAYEEDPNGFAIPRGVRMLTSGSFASMKDAETYAKELSMTWAALLCFSMGVKAALPRIECVLQRIDAGGRFRLRVYSYGSMAITPNLPLDVDLLTTIHQSIAALPERAMAHVALAVRWYTVGLGQEDDLNRFLSHWIGLEAIGDLLHNKVHIADRAACQVCNHSAGRDHRGRAGGMKHALAVVSGRPELYTEVDHARDRLFHGLDDIQLHRETIVRNVATLELALARGILEVITSPGSNEVLSASEPLRTVGPSPDLMFEATLLDLTDEELRLILYHKAVQVLSEVESGQNEDDGGLRLNVKPGISFPDAWDPRLVDRSFTWFTAQGIEYVPEL